VHVKHSRSIDTLTNIIIGTEGKLSTCFSLTAIEFLLLLAIAFQIRKPLPLLFLDLM